ncbi:hypothetical protein BJY54_006660 [Streptomyces nodosus]|nr:hypothetical protein [Streptomyces nodosus]
MLPDTCPYSLGNAMGTHGRPLIPVDHPGVAAPGMDAIRPRGRAVGGLPGRTRTGTYDDRTRQRAARR